MLGDTSIRSTTAVPSFCDGCGSSTGATRGAGTGVGDFVGALTGAGGLRPHPAAAASHIAASSTAPDARRRRDEFLTSCMATHLAGMNDPKNNPHLRGLA